MNYEQVFLYYSSRTDFDLDATIIFMGKRGYFLNHPKTKSITIYQKSGESEVNYEQVKQLLSNNESFSIILWLDSLSYSILSFYSEDEYFVLTFYLDQLNISQIKRASEVLLVYILNELKRVGDKILGFGIDTDGHTYDYDFEHFFDGTNKSIDLQYLPDIFLIPKERMDSIVIDNKFNLININDSFICIVKNKFLLTYLETLINLK